MQKITESIIFFFLATWAVLAQPINNNPTEIIGFGRIQEDKSVTSPDANILLMETTGGELMIVRLDDHSKEILARRTISFEQAQISNGGWRILLRQKDGILLWNRETGKDESIYKGLPNYITVDPTFRYCAIETDREIVIADLQTKEQRALITSASGCIEFSPDGKWLAMAHPPSVVDVQTGDIKVFMDIPYIPWSRASFDPGGSRILLNEGFTIQIYSIPGFELVKQLKISGTEHYLAEGQNVIITPNHGPEMNTYTTITSIDNPTLQTTLKGEFLLPPAATIPSSDIQGGTRTVFVTFDVFDQVFKRYEYRGIEGGQIVIKELNSFGGFTKTIHDLKMTPDGNRLLICMHDLYSIDWEFFSAGHIIVEYDLKTKEFHETDSSYDDQIHLNHRDNSVTVEGRKIELFPPLEDAGYSPYPYERIVIALLSPNRKLIGVVIESGEVKFFSTCYDIGLWDVETGNLLIRTNGYISPFWAEFSPDSRFFMVRGADYNKSFTPTEDQIISLEKLPSYSFIKTQLINTETLDFWAIRRDAAFSSDGNYIITDDHYQATLCDSRTGEALCRFDPGVYLTAVCFSYDEKEIYVAGEDGKIYRFANPFQAGIEDWSLQ